MSDTPQPANSNSSPPSRAREGREARAGRANSQSPGLTCPSCGCAELPVYYTRQRLNRIVRVRRCRHCDRKISTTERVAGGVGE